MRCIKKGLFGDTTTTNTITADTTITDTTTTDTTTSLTSRQIKCPATEVRLPGGPVDLDTVDADRTVFQVNAICQLVAYCL